MTGKLKVAQFHKSLRKKVKSASFQECGPRNPWVHKTEMITSPFWAGEPPSQTNNYSSCCLTQKRKHRTLKAFILLLPSLTAYFWPLAPLILAKVSRFFARKAVLSGVPGCAVWAGEGIQGIDLVP